MTEPEVVYVFRVVGAEGAPLELLPMELGKRLPVAAFQGRELAEDACRRLVAKTDLELKVMPLTRKELDAYILDAMVMDPPGRPEEGLRRIASFLAFQAEGVRLIPFLPSDLGKAGDATP